MSKSVKEGSIQVSDRVRKELGLVPVNYHTSLWLSVGMAAFGLVIGAAISAISGQSSLFATGLPMGVGLGVTLGLGAYLNEKAKKENRVLKISRGIVNTADKVWQVQKEK